MTGKPYTSETVQYGANGRPESALFGNGMTEIWTYELDGSYEAAFADVTGASYTALQDSYNSSAELETSLTTNTNGTYTLRGHQDGLTLTATENHETLIGGGADETFSFPTPFGHDTLGDFASHLTGLAGDTLSLPGAAFSDSFAQLLAATNFTGSGATITVDAGDTIFIRGLTETAMTANSAISLSIADDRGGRRLFRLEGEVRRGGRAITLNPPLRANRAFDGNQHVRLTWITMPVVAVD